MSIVCVIYIRDTALTVTQVHLCYDGLVANLSGENQQPVDGPVERLVWLGASGCLLQKQSAASVFAEVPFGVG